MFQYPDANTKWKSQDEMIRVRSARNERGQRFMDVDEYYRRSVESKDALGYELSDGPEVHFKDVLRVTVTEDDHQQTREVIRLKGELESLTLQTEAAERQAVLDAAKGVEGASRPDVKPFESREAMQRAISDPAYRSNPAYNAHVAERIAATDLSGEGFDLRINPEREGGF